MKYACSECHMAVKGLNCAKCDAPLQHDHIEVDGKQIAVSKCAACGGMIKSPQCCGHDMQAQG